MKLRFVALHALLSVLPMIFFVFSLTVFVFESDRDFAIEMLNSGIAGLTLVFLISSHAVIHSEVRSMLLKPTFLRLASCFMPTAIVASASFIGYAVLLESYSYSFVEPHLERDMPSVIMMNGLWILVLIGMCEVGRFVSRKLIERISSERRSVSQPTLQQ